MSVASALPMVGQQTASPAKPAKSQDSSEKDLAKAYYHAGLAGLYEEMVTSYGQPDLASQAVEEYKLALNYDPDNANLQASLAEFYLKIGRIRDAVATAEAMIQRNPNDVKAHKLLARVYLHSLGDAQGQQTQEMLKLAIAEQETLVRLQPKSVEDHLILGQLYANVPQMDKSRAEFETARSLDPGSEDAVLNLARLYDEQGDTAATIHVLEEVPEAQRSDKIELALANTYDEARQPKQAIAAYKRLLDKDPENADVQRALARDYMLNGDMADAQKLYKQIADADPNDATSLVRLSDIQRRQGDYNAALETLKKAQPAAKDQPDVENELEYNKALIEDSLGHYDDAIHTLETLLDATRHGDGKYNDSEKNNRGIFLERLANTYREQGKTEKAVAAYREMADLGGDYQVRGDQFIVDTWRDAHDFDKALAVAREAAKQSPDNRDLQLMLATQLCDTGHVDEGLKLANAQLKGNPQDRDIYIQIAQIDQRLKKYSDAAAALNKAEALATSPEEHVLIYFERGALAEQQKHYDEAEAQFKKVLEIDPNNAAALNYLGYMDADRGIRLDESLKMIRHAVELDPQNGAYLDSLGWVYFKMGQYELAEQNLRSAVDRQPDDPSLHDHLGQLYEKTGRLKLAAQQWEEALKLYASANPADVEPGDRERVEKHLESARMKMARGGNATVNK